VGVSDGRHWMFFGALDAGKLSFGERMVVKAVKAPEGDFRNWDEIAHWARGIVLALSSG
jgi:menaquinone-dependent protoporphyrinogen oxidase